MKKKDLEDPGNFIPYMKTTLKTAGVMRVRGGRRGHKMAPTSNGMRGVQHRDALKKLWSRHFNDKAAEK